MLMGAMKIVCIGEILWDVFPDAEHLGGASFNFAAHARRFGHEVLFVSGVGDDDRGRRALARAGELGLSTRFIQVIPGAATGIVSVEVDSAGQPSFTIHRPAAYDYATLDQADLDELTSPAADWVAYGTLFQMTGATRALTERLLRAAEGSSFFYDVNLRSASYDEQTVRRSLEFADIVKMNDAEVAILASTFGVPCESTGAFSRSFAERFGLSSVSVTMGARGCALLGNGEFVEAPGYPVQVADTVGSGDAFSAALLDGIGRGWPASRIADFANRVGALVASRAGAIPDWTIAEAASLTRF